MRVKTNNESGEMSRRIKGNFHAAITGNTAAKSVRISYDYDDPAEAIFRIWGATSNGNRFSDRIVHCDSANGCVTTVVTNTGSLDLTCTWNGNKQFTAPTYNWDIVTIIASVRFSVTYV